MITFKTRLAAMALAAGLIAGSASGALAQTTNANANISPDTSNVSDSSQAPNNAGAVIYNHTGQAMPAAQTDNMSDQSNSNGNSAAAGSSNNLYQNAPQQNAGSTAAPNDTAAAQVHNGMTADNAGQNLSDRDIMQKIRKSVVADGNLSISAHNVKIIAKNGHVVLKGAVDSESEKQAVVTKANAVVGSDNVIDRLSIATP